MALKTYRTHGVSIKYDDYTPQALAALKSATLRGLKLCGEKGAEYAKRELERPKKHKDGSTRPNIITSTLVNSIKSEVVTQGRGNKMVVGTPVEYAEYVENGTINTWAYPFIKPAMTEHNDEYKQILKNSLENA